MKKITFLIALCFMAFQGNAQIAAGSVAPDFTVTDLNGNVHTLSEYLAAGKTVIMDVSATWCGPCWNYHNTKALEDLYKAYGPNASNEVVVLFVEGDPQTTLADLNGTGTNTQGNWVENTPYPIIDNAALGELYQIQYFPTVFRICPDGLVSEVGAVTAGSLRGSINNFCAPLNGVQNYVEAVATENGFCATTARPIAKVKNFGENILTSATIDLKADGVVVATQEFAGTINRFVTKSFTFDQMIVDHAADYTIDVTAVNSAPLFTTASAQAGMGVYVAAQASTDIVIKVYTDNYPSEISWVLKNGSTTVATGGPYAGTAAGGGPDANTTKIHNLSIPINGCYTIQLKDSYGDGWGYGSTPHGLEIFSNDQSVYNIAVGNFGSLINKPNVITTTALSIGELTTSKFGIYPNPTSGLFQINTESPVQVSIIDVMGKLVHTANNVSGEMSVDLSGLEKGIYFAKIKGQQGTSTEKVILK